VKVLCPDRISSGGGGTYERTNMSFHLALVELADFFLELLKYMKDQSTTPLPKLEFCQ